MENTNHSKEEIARIADGLSDILWKALQDLSRYSDKSWLSAGKGAFDRDAG